MIADGNSIAERVRKRVKRIPKGHPFTLRRFNHVGELSGGAIGKAVARLVQSGELERVFRGVYMRPKVSRYIGKVRPNAIAIAQMLAKEKGHLLQIHGAEAVRHLGLSTQMQIQPIYYTSGPNQVIRIRSINPTCP